MDDMKLTWYGQLMTGPQTMAYFLQINEWLKRFIHRSIGTIILGSREIEYDPVFDALIKCTKVPHVFLNGTSDYENVSTVVADVSCGCNEMLEHFAEQGVRELGLVYFEKNEYNIIRTVCKRNYVLFAGRKRMFIIETLLIFGRVLFRVINMELL